MTCKKSTQTSLIQSDSDIRTRSEVWKYVHISGSFFYPCLYLYIGIWLGIRKHLIRGFFLSSSQTVLELYSMSWVLTQVQILTSLRLPISADVCDADFCSRPTSDTSRMMVSRLALVSSSVFCSVSDRVTILPFKMAFSWFKSEIWKYARFF